MYMYEERNDGFFTELIKFAFIAFLIVVPVRLYIAQPFFVSGQSMDPTFHDGQYLIIDELSYRFSEPKRGDVIIFKYPKDPSLYFIKRIIGLPGETVSVTNDTTTITKTDGTAIVRNESYVGNRGSGSVTYILNSDQYFVMGDNRPESSDSRVWGPLPRENIVGHALLRMFPVDTFDIFPGSSIQPQ